MRQVSSAVVKAMVRYSTSALEPFSTFFDAGHNLLFNLCNYLIL